ncbi:MAG: hypothetical protein HQL66_14880, partial [Magnetococcales bacterium]|nr:hypothetical protein [Magnetococcales bacterium]
MDSSEEGLEADQVSAEVAPSGKGGRGLRKRGVLAVGLLLVAWIGLGVYLWPVLRDPQRLAMASTPLEGVMPGLGVGGGHGAPGGAAAVGGVESESGGSGKPEG